MSSIFPPFSTVRGLLRKHLPGRNYSPLTSVFFTNLTARFGRIEKFDGPTGNGNFGWTAFRLHCQRGVLIMSVALDASDNLSGIHFRPAFWQSLTFKSFIPRLFNSLHLVLIAPFIQARFLCSRMLR